MTDILTLDRVSFAYPRGGAVLHEVSLSLTAGRSLGLVGQSGSGKSTILRLLLGLARPSAGEIRFDGSALDLSDRERLRAYRRDVQAVFQDPYASLDPRQRVASIVGEPLRALGVSGDHRAMIRSALEAVGLAGDVVDRYPHAFSGGQRQRIAIARAIVARPRVVLADEAVSALDLSTKVRIVDLFRELASRMTLLFVSHDIAVVAALCDDIAILDRGSIVEAGPIRRVLDQPRDGYTQQLLASVPRMPDFLNGR